MAQAHHSEVIQEPARNVGVLVPGQSATDDARSRVAREAAMANLGSPVTMCEAFQATAARCPQQVALRAPAGR